MPNVIKYYILLFFFSAFLGWLMEVGCKLVQFHRFINRGFLLGPWCPIYGFGSVLITSLLSRYADSPLAVFCLAMVVCGTLEYLTSYFMEKLFHARWWDYSQKRFNLNGRVCADTLIPFGLLGLGMIYGVKPFLFRYFAMLSDGWLNGLCIGLIVVFLADTILSTCVLGKIRHSAANEKGDSTEAITKAVRERLAHDSALVRRTLHAFPYARLYSRDLAKRVKEQRRALRRDIKAAQARMQQDIREELAKRRGK